MNTKMLLKIRKTIVFTIEVVAYNTVFAGFSFL